MSSSRRSNILSLLAKKPMNIISLTNTFNENFQKGYAPSLIGIDIKTLMTLGLVSMSSSKTFSLTQLGLTQINIEGEQKRSNDQSKEVQEESV